MSALIESNPPEFPSITCLAKGDAAWTRSNRVSKSGSSISTPVVNSFLVATGALATVFGPVVVKAPTPIELVEKMIAAAAKCFIVFVIEIKNRRNMKHKF